LRLKTSRPAFAPEARRALAGLALRPGLVFLHGHQQASRLAHYFLAAPLVRGETVLFLDAANCFDPYLLARWAKRWRCDFHHRGTEGTEETQRKAGMTAQGEGLGTEEVLRRVRVSRAFTCFQMAELIERTAEAAQRFRARCVVLTGFPDIFDDEEIPAAQAQTAFARTRPHFRHWLALRLHALAFSDGTARPTPLRRWLGRQLTQWATAVYRLEEGPAGLVLGEEGGRERIGSMGSIGKRLPHPSARLDWRRGLLRAGRTQRES
jgi:hypothetical protein